MPGVSTLSASPEAVTLASLGAAATSAGAGMALGTAGAAGGGASAAFGASGAAALAGRLAALRGESLEVASGGVLLHPSKVEANASDEQRTRE